MVEVGGGSIAAILGGVVGGGGEQPAAVREIPDHNTKFLIEHQLEKKFVPEEQPLQPQLLTLTLPHPQSGEKRTGWGGVGQKLPQHTNYDIKFLTEQPDGEAGQRAGLVTSMPRYPALPDAYSRALHQ